LIHRQRIGNVNVATGELQATGGTFTDNFYRYPFEVRFIAWEMLLLAPGRFLVAAQKKVLLLRQ